MNKLEYDLDNFVRVCHLHDKVANLEQALAEKEQEITSLVAANQQLMAKAVRFAEFTWILGPTGKEAEEFLSSPKTKAFLKEHRP